MNLFNADLFRSLAVGFALGTLGLVLVMGANGDDLGSTLVPHAVAAPAEGH